MYWVLCQILFWIKGGFYSLNNRISMCDEDVLEKTSLSRPFAVKIGLLKKENTIGRLWIDLIASSSQGLQVPWTSRSCASIQNCYFYEKWGK